jgi:hypothetical protein
MLQNQQDLWEIYTNTWFDISVASYVPTGTTGVIVTLDGDTLHKCDTVRKKGSTDTIVANIPETPRQVVTAFVGVDENLKFQAYKGDSEPAYNIQLIGYTDSAVQFFTNIIDITPTSYDTWVNKDLSASVPQGATGIIARIRNTGDPNGYIYGGVRHPSSTSEVTYGKIYGYYYQLCGISSARIVQVKISSNYAKVDLVGYTKPPVTFLINPVDVGLTTYDTWYDVDVTSITSSTANTAIVIMRNTQTSGSPSSHYNGVRPKGTTNYPTQSYDLWEASRGDIVLLDANQVFQGYLDTTFDHIYLIGYSQPAPLNIGDFQAPSTCYANKYFFLNATVTHSTITKLINATVEITGSVKLKWDNASDTFSEVSDPSNYCTLDDANSLRTPINASAYRLSWKIKLNWTYPEGSVNIVSAYCIDTDGYEATNTKTNFFTFEDDLVVATATVDDNHANPNQTVTFNAYLYYEGTTTPPEDTSGITAKLKLGTDILNSTTTIEANGKFTLSTNLPLTVDKYTYTLLATTDQDTVQNQNIDVIVDKLSVVFSAYPTEAGKDQTVTISWEIKRYYDGSTVTDFTIDISRNATLWQSLANTTSTTDVHNTLVTYVYDVYPSSVTDNTYDLNTWTSTPVYVAWIPQEERPPSEEEGQQPPAPPPEYVPTPTPTPTPAFDITQILTYIINWAQQNTRILILLIVIAVIIYAWRKR